GKQFLIGRSKSAAIKLVMNFEKAKQVALSGDDGSGKCRADAELFAERVDDLVVASSIVRQIGLFMNDQPSGEPVHWRPAVFQWQRLSFWKVLLTVHAVVRQKAGNTRLRTDQSDCFTNQDLQKRLHIESRIEE